MDKVLPPLPPCDDESLANNVFDSQFRTGARDFWGDNKIEKISLSDPKKCEHFFIGTTDGVQCKKCRAGWVGKEMEARDGKLYVQNKMIDFC